MDFEGQKKIPHFEIPLKFLRDKFFLKWLGSSEGIIYLYLYSYIIRSNEVTTKIGKLIYAKYYKRNILASSWDQKTMAEKVGFSINSAGHVSRLLTSMSNRGIIKKHKDRLNRRSINIYEFGTHDGEPYKHETLDLFKYFTKLNAEKTMSDFLGGNWPIAWEEIGI